MGEIPARDLLSELRIYLFTGSLPGKTFEGIASLKYMDLYLQAEAKRRSPLKTMPPAVASENYKTSCQALCKIFNELHEPAVELMKVDRHEEVIDLCKEVLANRRGCWHAVFACLATMLRGEYRSVECTVSIYASLPSIIKNSTVLFFFLQALKIAAPNCSKCGWGRGLRSVVRRWYGSLSGSRLLLEMWHRPHAHGWEHKDVIKLAHIKLDKFNIDCKVLLTWYFSDLAATKVTFAAVKEAADFIGKLDCLYNRGHEEALPEKRLEVLLGVDDQQYSLVKPQDPMLKNPQLFSQLFPRLRGNAVTSVAMDSDFVAAVTPIRRLPPAVPGDIIVKMKGLQLVSGQPPPAAPLDISDGDVGAFSDADEGAADPVAGSGEDSGVGGSVAAPPPELLWHYVKPETQELLETVPEDPEPTPLMVESSKLLTARLQKDDVYLTTTAVSAAIALNAFIRRVKHTTENVEGRNVWRRGIDPPVAPHGQKNAWRFTIPKHLVPLLDELDNVVVNSSKMSSMARFHSDLLAVVEPHYYCLCFVNTELGHGIYKQIKGTQAIMITLLDLCFIENDDLGGFGDRVALHRDNIFEPFRLTEGDFKTQVKEMQHICQHNGRDSPAVDWDELWQHCHGIGKHELVYICHQITVNQLDVYKYLAKKDITDRSLKKIVLVGLNYTFLLGDRVQHSSRLLVVNGFGKRTIEIIEAFLDNQY
uniref:60 kDa SS-A/Ro ribonucleoprotein-like n=1 Tax=Hirondellea gigas TaxID=1518452 RepID=A0A2P2HWM5_9CRUS